MTNLEASKKIINQLVAFGVTDFVICPGGRCAPLLSVIESTEAINTHHFFDERSASFFALGLGKKTNKPAVVVTTSGTAVSECLSAFIEAYYSATPIIILSADRPKSFRGSGAPQAIDQAHLFSGFATHEYDLEGETQLNQLSGQVHINIGFDEPLLGQKTKQVVSKVSAEGFFKKPLVIVGALTHDERESVALFLKKHNLMSYLESSSNLKSEPEINQLKIHSSQLSLSYVESVFDSIIRIGSVPTIRLWRDLEKSNLPVKSFSKAIFSGLSRIKESARPISSLNVPGEINDGVNDGLKSLNYNYEKYPLAEPSFIYYLSSIIPEDSVVFLGNSMVIRNWDDFAETKKKQKIYANRGANGIDGLISTAMGCAEAGKDLWVVVGDQSALYDMQALWAHQSLENVRLRVVVINNGGGKIFSKIFKDNKLLESLENNHSLSFKPWAQMFNMDYHLVTDSEGFKKYNEEAIVIECVIDNNQTINFLDSLHV